MKYVKSYNSSYPLAYYEVGTVYSFYGRSSAKVALAAADTIEKYAPALNELMVEERENAIKPSKRKTPSVGVNGVMKRFYAVVVDKVKSDKAAHIVVMFCNKQDGKSAYYTRDYAVNFGCATDGKELMNPSTHLNFKTEQGGRIGQITLARNGEKTGGVTRTGENQTTSPSVGGVTAVQK